MTPIDTPVNWPPAIDHTNPVPYYAQVKEALRGRIERGEWKPGDQLPGEPSLCSLFDVSLTVIRQAQTELMYEGLILREIAECDPETRIGIEDKIEKAGTTAGLAWTSCPGARVRWPPAPAASPCGKPVACCRPGWTALRCARCRRSRMPSKRSGSSNRCWSQNRIAGKTVELTIDWERMSIIH